jgi:hypothetical protein
MPFNINIPTFEHLFQPLNFHFLDINTMIGLHGERPVIYHFFVKIRSKSPTQLVSKFSVNSGGSISSKTQRNMIREGSIQTMHTDVVISKIPLRTSQESVQFLKSRVTLIIRPSEQPVIQIKFN